MKKLTSLTFLLLVFIFTQAQTFKEYEQKASECFSSGDYSCVEKNILASIQLLDKDDKRLWISYTNLGTAQRRLQKREEALDSYNKAFELNPNSSPILSSRASLKREMERLDESLLDYNLAIDLNPNDIELLANRSITKRLLGDIAGAEDDLVKALKMRPDDFQLFTNLQNIKVMKGESEYESVLNNYNKMIAEHPNEPILFNNRADLYLKMKKYQMALSDANTCLKLGDKYANGYVTRAEILIEMGKRKKALEDLQNAVKLGMNSTYVFKLTDECRKY